MPQKKQIRNRKKKRLSFFKALGEARRELLAKTKERDLCTARLRVLNMQIPNLERTARALEAQLGGTGPVTRPTSQSDTKQVGAVLPSRIDWDSQKFTPEQVGEIPPEVLAKLPPEDLSKFGSHFGTEPPEKEDFLPEITGKEVIPEKKA